MSRIYQHTLELLPQIKEMLAKGKTHKEIEDALGLVGDRPIHNLLKSYAEILLTLSNQKKEISQLWRLSAQVSQLVEQRFLCRKTKSKVGYGYFLHTHKTRCSLSLGNQRFVRQ